MPDSLADPNDAPEVAVKQSTISSIEPSVFKSSQAPMYFVSVLAKDLLNSRIDQTSLVLLLLLVLLTPDRPGLTPAASELVEREQLHVALLLQRYLRMHISLFSPLPIVDARRPLYSRRFGLVANCSAIISPLSPILYV